jgi:hypothetical protein
MKKPDLQMLAQWLDPALVAALETRRRLKKEWHRRRKLATLQTLWLMLAVSLDTQRSSLHDILRLATGQLDFQFSVSVAAFCKARARFSPQRPIMVVWRIGIALANRLQPSAPPLARVTGLRPIAADKTTLALPESPSLWKRFGAHKGQQGLGPIAVELCCLFDLVSRAPLRFVFDKVCTSEHKLILKLIRALKKGDLLLIDSGFYYCATFIKILARKAHFLIPAKANNRPKVLRTLGHCVLSAKEIIYAKSRTPTTIQLSSSGCFSFIERAFADAAWLPLCWTRLCFRLQNWQTFITCAGISKRSTVISNTP